MMSPSRLALLLLNLIDQQSLEHLLLAHQSVLDVVKPVSQVDHLILDKVNHLLLLVLCLDPEMLELIPFLSEFLEPVTHDILVGLEVLGLNTFRNHELLLEVHRPVDVSISLSKCVLR